MCFAAGACRLGACGECVDSPTHLRDAVDRDFMRATAIVDVPISQDAVSSDAGKEFGFVSDDQALTAGDVADRRCRTDNMRAGTLKPACSPSGDAPFGRHD